MAESPDSHGDSRACPTRPDGTDPLIVHWIGSEVCGVRQAAHYHKCASCIYHCAAPGAASVRPVERVLDKAPPVLPLEVEAPRKPARVSHAV